MKLLGVVNEVGGGFGIGISCHSQSPSDGEKRINVFRAL